MCQITAPPDMTFASRTEAGQRLGRYLAEQNIRADLVSGLPRGGVVVAAEVARILQCPLDVLVVRKIGHPGHREFAVGALAEDSTLVLDEEVINRTGVSPADLKEVLTEETERLMEYQARFLRPNRPLKTAEPPKSSWLPRSRRTTRSSAWGVWRTKWWRSWLTQSSTRWGAIIGVFHRRRMRKWRRF